MIGAAGVSGNDFLKFGNRNGNRSTHIQLLFPNGVWPNSMKTVYSQFCKGELIPKIFVPTLEVHF